jgi:hypothetical protein
MRRPGKGLPPRSFQLEVVWKGSRFPNRTRRPRAEAQRRGGVFDLAMGVGRPRALVHAFLGNPFSADQGSCSIPCPPYSPLCASARVLPTGAVWIGSDAFFGFFLEPLLDPGKLELLVGVPVGSGIPNLEGTNQRSSNRRHPWRAFGNQEGCRRGRERSASNDTVRMPPTLWGNQTKASRGRVSICLRPCKRRPACPGLIRTVIARLSRSYPWPLLVVCFLGGADGARSLDDVSSE